MDLNFGIIGLGSIAFDAHAPALRKVEGARLWSVLSRDSSRATKFAERHRAAAPRPAHTDLGEFLSDPGLDAVIICTPDMLHAEQTLTAARAGKHVLVEKPMSVDVDSCRRMIAACREANTRLGVGYNLRWHEGHRLVREALRSGEIGEPHHMRLQWTVRFPDAASNWRASANTSRWWSLSGMGTHLLDLVRWMMPPIAGEIEQIACVLRQSIAGSSHDDTAVVSLRFQSDATAEFCTSVLFDSETRMEIYGSEGRIVCDGTIGRHALGKITVNDVPLAFARTDMFARQIAEFVAAIRHSRDPEANGNDGLRNVQLLVEAVRNSAGA